MGGVVAMVVVSCSSAGSVGRSNPIVPTGSSPGPAVVRLRELASQLVDAGVSGVVVRVDDGREVVRFAVGAGQLSPQRALDVGDEVRVGSITEMFVATIALQLVAEHRLGLEDPVERWLPGQVPNGQSITIRELLNHTSGLYDYVRDPVVEQEFSGQQVPAPDPRGLLALAVAHPPLFPPGTRWAYSNTDYLAVGLVLEKVTGRSVADLLAQRIARPLGLQHTYLATDSRFRGVYAHGYEPVGNFQGPAYQGKIDASGLDPRWYWAAGGVVSTADDLARFAGALMSGTLLPAAQLAQMETTVAETNPPSGPSTPATASQSPANTGAGLGLFHTTFQCGQVWGHGGVVPGYRTDLAADPSGHRTAQVLALTTLHTSTQRATWTALTETATCAMYDKPPPTP